jgi:hypothetical protein
VCIVTDCLLLTISKWSFLGIDSNPCCDLSLESKVEESKKFKESGDDYWTPGIVKPKEVMKQNNGKLAKVHNQKKTNNNITTNKFNEGR